MIKRSIPTTLVVRCPNADYADGVKDGIMYALECLLHECDVIMRKSPEVTRAIISDKNGDHQYQVRARFTARSKRTDKQKGEWIKVNSAFYEEDFDDQYMAAKPLSDEFYDDIKEFLRSEE